MKAAFTAFMKVCYSFKKYISVFFEKTMKNPKKKSSFFENKLPVILSIIAMLFSAASFIFSYEASERPSLKPVSTHKLIGIKNQGKGLAKLTNMLFEKDSDFHCLNEEKITTILEGEIADYEQPSSGLTINKELGVGETGEVIVCKYCAETDSRYPLDDLSIHVEYQGVGVFYSIYHKLYGPFYYGNPIELTNKSDCT